MNFELEIQKHFETAFSKVVSKQTSPKISSKADSKNLGPAQKLLKKALLYSFKGKAGRFRPRLCFETAQLLGHKPSQILPWAIALEMVHTASLIHDDMPCMDHAESRRGQKCNHLIFGEDIALLAGACLFVESFSLLNASLFDNKRSEFLDLLVKTVGFHGLMSGQAMDLKNKSPNKKELLKTMNLKTGVLISACALGPALLWADKKEYKALEKFARHLGLAYQLADDYQDLSQDNNKLINEKQKASQDSAQNKYLKLDKDKNQKSKNHKDLSQNLSKQDRNSKKSWLYKKGISHLEKSSKALSLFKKRNKGLNLFIKEIKKKYQI